jgi:predicted transposase YbfD/YdcC
VSIRCRLVRTVRIRCVNTYQEPSPGDRATTIVPQIGRLVATGDLWEPYRLLDVNGVKVEPVSIYFRELQAAERSATTVRSYGMDLLRWFRFLWAIEVAWDRAARTLAGKKSVEVVYVITSLASTQASPAQIAAWVQGHWGIENKLHWVRDVVYDEDRPSVRTGQAPRVMAILRSTAISVLRLTGASSIAAGTRHHARNPARPVQLLLTC